MIGPDGEQVGVLPVREAISQAEDPQVAAHRLVELAKQVIPHPAFGP